MLLIDRALESAYIAGGIGSLEISDLEICVLSGLQASDVGPSDIALLPAAEVALLTGTHLVDPEFGISTSESGAIAMRTPVRPDEIEEASILLYNVSGTAELLARATIWPFYGIKTTAWATEADGTSTIAIVDGTDALEAPEAGFSEDLVRAWYILTEQPVVTHLLVTPFEATGVQIERARLTLADAAAVGYANRRELRKAIQAESRVDAQRLIDFLARIRYDLDGPARTAAYSLIARGSGGTRYPLLREIPWRVDSLPGSL